MLISLSIPTVNFLVSYFTIANPIYIAALFEPEYVNQRRKEVGLSPIEDYVKRWGIKWDIEQKET